jgi:hypothetical protein
MSLHKNLPYTEVHGVYAFTYVNAAARTAATGFTADDVGKLALQTNDNTLWLLTDDSPVTWKDISQGSATGDVVGPASSSDNTVVRFDGTTGKLVQGSNVLIADNGNITTSGLFNGRDVAADGNAIDSYLPTNSEKDALVGSFGSPGSANPYVTDLDPRFNQDGRVLTVALAGGDFTSVKAAVDSIVDATSVKTYLVQVAPGVYTEDPFTIPAYVTVRGLGEYDQSCTIQTSNNSAHFITMSANAWLANLGVKGPTGSTYAAIHYNGTGTSPAFVFNVAILTGYYGILVDPTSYGVLHCRDVVNRYSGSAINQFIRVTDYGVVMTMLCSFMSGPSAAVDKGFVCIGQNARMTLDMCAFRNSGATSAIYADDGATIRGISCSLSAGINAVHIGNIGNNTRVDLVSSFIKEVFTRDIYAETASCIITFNGCASFDKIVLTDPTVLTATFCDKSNLGFTVFGDLFTQQSNGNVFSLSDLITQTVDTGKITGGLLSASGLNINVTSGNGYITNGIGLVEEVAWTATGLAVGTNIDHGHIIVDDNNVVQAINYTPDITNKIILGEFTTSASSVELLVARSVELWNHTSRHYQFLEDVIGPVNVTGGTVTKFANPSLFVNADNSAFYIADTFFETTASSPVIFTQWYRDGGSGWNHIASVSGISNTQYDNGSGTLASIPSSHYVRHSLFVSVNDGDTTYHLVTGQEAFATSGLALTNPNPPEVLSHAACFLAAIVTQQGNNDIVAIYDQRPRLGQLASNTTSVTSHGQLSGLGSDDHTQYQLRSEKNTANGYVGLTGSTKVDPTYLTLADTPPGTISVGAGAVGVSTDLAREDHNHNISTGTPGAVTPGNSASAGVATSLARSDHQHSIAAFGSSVGTFCEGNDARLSNDRTASGLRSATTVVSVSAATAPTAGQVLTATSGTAAEWSSVAGTNGRIIQHTFNEISADTTTTSTTFTNLLTRTITTGANKIDIHFSCSASESTNNAQIYFQLLIDGSPVRGTGNHYTPANATRANSLVYSTTVTAASHTFTIQWRVTSGTGQIRPVTTINEHASLLIHEIN